MTEPLTFDEIVRILAEEFGLPTPILDGAFITLPAPRDPTGPGLSLLAVPPDARGDTGERGRHWIVPPDYWQQARIHLEANLASRHGNEPA